jgi:PPP family 3-phenylpropionic acid transporter
MRAGVRPGGSGPPVPAKRPRRTGRRSPPPGARRRPRLTAVPGPAIVHRRRLPSPGTALALFYFAMFLASGIVQSYLPPYYRTLGLGGVEIAALGSIQAVLVVAVPPVWGFWADRTGRPARLLLVAATGAALGFVPLLGARTFAAVGATLLAFGAFQAGIGGLADAVAVGEARRRGGSFARIRLWGSVGFVVSSWLFGVWLDRGGRLADAVPAALACLVATALAALPLRSDPGARLDPPTFADARRLVADPAFLLFLAASALHWASLSPFHLFWAMHLGDLGVAATWIGAGIAAGVIAEVAVMWLFPALAHRFSLYGLLAAAYLSGAGRWALTAVLDDGPLLAAVQVLHGLVFGGFFVGSIAHLARTVPPQLLATGRALFGAVAFGAGGLLGNAAAGALYDAGGGRLAYSLAAALELAALPLLALAARRARHPQVAIAPAASAHPPGAS